jgi:hypothetical protein
LKIKEGWGVEARLLEIMLLRLGVRIAPPTFPIEKINHYIFMTKDLL